MLNGNTQLLLDIARCLVLNQHNEMGTLSDCDTVTGCKNISMMDDIQRLEHWNSDIAKSPDSIPEFIYMMKPMHIQELYGRMDN